MLGAVQSLYFGSLLSMRVNGQCGHSQSPSLGLRQGCPLNPHSATLFGIFIENSFPSYLVSGQYPPSTGFMLLRVPLGITGVEGVSLESRVVIMTQKYCCSAAVISTIIMSGLILLRVSAAPLCEKSLRTVGSKPLAC